MGCLYRLGAGGGVLCLICLFFRATRSDDLFQGTFQIASLKSPPLFSVKKKKVMRHEIHICCVCFGFSWNVFEIIWTRALSQPRRIFQKGFKMNWWCYSIELAFNFKSIYILLGSFQVQRHFSLAILALCLTEWCKNGEIVHWWEPQRAATWLHSILRINIFHVPLWCFVLWT